MKRKIYLTGLVCIILSVTLNGQNSDDFLNTLNRGINSYFQEKAHDNLFLHIDRSFYFPGDEIFFKAYVTDAATMLPSNRSNQFTLLMVDNQGNEVYSSTIKIIKGESWGKFQVPENMEQGAYHLIGFALNKNSITANKVFNKSLFIIDPSQGFFLEYAMNKKVFEPGDNVELKIKSYASRPLKNLKIYYKFSDTSEIKMEDNLKTDKEGEAVIHFDITSNVSVNMEIKAVKKRSEQSIMISIPIEKTVESIEFYPEGGLLVTGISGKIAFRAYDAMGLPVDFVGGLYEDDQKLMDVSSIGEGIGIFTFSHQEGKKYQLRIGSTGQLVFDLPAASTNGVAIKIESLRDEKLNLITAYCGSDYPADKMVIVAVFRKGLLYWSAPGTLGQTGRLTIPLKRMPSGISKVAMFSRDGQLLSERMFYHKNQSTPKMEISMKKLEYGSRKRVEASISLLGPVPGNAERISLSVSVVPEDLLMGKSLLLDNYMMLDADLQENTQSILQESEIAENTPEILDAVLLTFQWNGYSWDRVLGKETDEKVWNEGDIKNEQSTVFSTMKFYPDVIKASSLWDLSNGIADKRHPGVGDEHYIKQLESGVSVLDVIKGIKPYTMYGSRIVFAGSNNSINNQQGALIVIDGQQMGEDASVLSTIAPSQVEKIFVSTSPGDIHQYTGLNVVGVIEISLKGSGNESRLSVTTQRDKDIEEANGAYLDGYPNYSKEEDAKSVLLDDRTLLFWKPDLILDENNTQKIEFYTSDTKGKYVLTVQGMVGTHPVAKQVVFEIK